MSTSIIDITLEETRKWGNAVFLNEGLVLTDQIMAERLSAGPARLEFILMALCQKGTAQYTINTHRQTVNPGDLFFVSERFIIDDFTASDDFQCHCIMLTTPFYHSFVLNVKNVSTLLLFSRNFPVVSLTEQEGQTFNYYFDTVRSKIADDTNHYRVELVKAFLLAEFYDLSNVIWRVEHRESKSQSRADVIFSQFIRLLEENFKSERFVNWYAKKMNITPKYLSDICKQVSMRTANEWIDNYVVLELRVLLRNSSKSIKDITEELNFPNQSFLGKYFKEHVGMSPSEYRRK
jgi:AraC-like DNA-binding protein